jgi:hypothetical protein
MAEGSSLSSCPAPRCFVWLVLAPPYYPSRLRRVHYGRSPTPPSQTRHCRAHKYLRRRSVGFVSCIKYPTLSQADGRSTYHYLPIRCIRLNTVAEFFRSTHCARRRGGHDDPYFRPFRRAFSIGSASACSAGDWRTHDRAHLQPACLNKRPCSRLEGNKANGPHAPLSCHRRL